MQMIFFLTFIVADRFVVSSGLCPLPAIGMLLKSCVSFCDCTDRLVLMLYILKDPVLKCRSGHRLSQLFSSFLSVSQASFGIAAQN